MGKTVVSYRQAIESEIVKWEGFRKALRTEDDAAFDMMMNACRMHASAGSMATRPILFEAMVMSILLNQEKVIMEIMKRLERIEKQFCQP